MNGLPLDRKISNLLTLPFPRDYLLAQYVPRLEGYNAPPLFNLAHAKWASSEVSVPDCYCIRGKTFSGHTILAWIDKKTYEVRRTILWAAQPLRKSEEGDGGTDPFGYEFIHFQEFYYRLQVVNPKFNDGGMRLLSPDRVVPFTIEDYDWATPEMLMRLFEIEG